MDYCFNSYQEFKEEYNSIEEYYSFKSTKDLFTEMHHYISENIIDLPSNLYLEDVTGPAGTVKELPGDHTPSLNKKGSKTNILEKIWQFIVKCWNSIGNFFKIIIKLVKNIAVNSEKILSRLDKTCELLNDKFGKDTPGMKEVFARADTETETKVFEAIKNDYMSLFGEIGSISPEIKNDINEIHQIISTGRFPKDKIISPEHTKANIAAVITFNKAYMILYLFNLIRFIFFLRSLVIGYRTKKSTSNLVPVVKSLESLSIALKNNITNQTSIIKQSPIGNDKYNFLIIDKKIPKLLKESIDKIQESSDAINKSATRFFLELKKYPLILADDGNKDLDELTTKVKSLEKSNDFLKDSGEIFQILSKMYSNIKKNEDNDPNIAGLLTIFAPSILALSTAVQERSIYLTKKENIANKLTNITNKLEKKLEENIKDDDIIDADYTIRTIEDNQKLITGSKDKKQLSGPKETKQLLPPSEKDIKIPKKYEKYRSLIIILIQKISQVNINIRMSIEQKVNIAITWVKKNGIGLALFGIAMLTAFFTGVSVAHAHDMQIAQQMIADTGTQTEMMKYAVHISSGTMDALKDLPQHVFSYINQFRTQAGMTGVPITKVLTGFLNSGGSQGSTFVPSHLFAGYMKTFLTRLFTDSGTITVAGLSIGTIIAGATSGLSSGVKKLGTTLSGLFKRKKTP